MELFHIEAEMTALLNDMSDEDLHSFAESQEDPASDEQIELYIYACFLVFKRSASAEHLEHAVQRTEGWVAVTPTDHPDRTRRSRIFDMMSAWVRQVASISEDIVPTLPGVNQELMFDETAINKAARLAENYQQTGRFEDLEEAVRIMERAVNIGGGFIQPGMLSSLGAMLGMRFERTGSMGDLNRAVEVAGMAVNATPQNHPNRTAYLNNFGNWLGSRFKRTGSMDDLNRAVEVAGMAVDATPQNHPKRAGCLNNLGNRLGSRFEQTGSTDDLNRSLSSYKEGWSCHTAPPSIRIRLARDAANILASQRNWDESSQLLREAVKLLPIVSPRSLNHTDKQHILANSAGLASMAAATALNAGKEAFHALQLLELGRGVIAGLLMDMRGDISDLTRKHPSLADEFIVLRNELDSPMDRSTFTNFSDNTCLWESQARRRREADQKFSELITNIRAQPGFDGFLRPPAAGDLMAAANPNPIIVVNLSSYRCDAFLVESDRIRVLELTGLTIKEVQKQAQNLRYSRATGSFHMAALLEWLWDTAARPCLNALGFKDPVSDNNWPRVWWIPTGLLSQLPLHAAGRHVRGSAETVLDRVMSSYASSVKALIHGRQRLVRKSAGPTSDQLFW
ncbi:hypothetical protein RB595_003837 [Gaeumannomyces hyphopodioides]